MYYDSIDFYMYGMVNYGDFEDLLRKSQYYKNFDTSTIIFASVVKYGKEYSIDFITEDDKDHYLVLVEDKNQIMNVEELYIKATNAIHKPEADHYSFIPSIMFDVLHCYLKYYSKRPLKELETPELILFHMMVSDIIGGYDEFLS